MTEIYFNKDKVGFYNISESLIIAVVDGYYLYWYQENDPKEFEIIKSKLKEIKND